MHLKCPDVLQPSQGPAGTEAAWKKPVSRWGARQNLESFMEKRVLYFVFLPEGFFGGYFFFCFCQKYHNCNPKVAWSLEKGPLFEQGMVRNAFHSGKQEVQGGRDSAVKSVSRRGTGQ